MIFNATDPDDALRIDHLKLERMTFDEVLHEGKVMLSRLGDLNLLKWTTDEHSPLRRRFYGIDNSLVQFDGRPKYVLILTVRNDNVCQYVRGFGDRRPSSEELALVHHLLHNNHISLHYDPMAYL